MYFLSLSLFPFLFPSLLSPFLFFAGGNHQVLQLIQSSSHHTSGEQFIQIYFENLTQDLRHELGFCNEVFVMVPIFLLWDWPKFSRQVAPFRWQHICSTVSQHTSEEGERYSKVYSVLMTCFILTTSVPDPFRTNSDKEIPSHVKMFLVAL